MIPIEEIKHYLYLILPASLVSIGLWFFIGNISLILTGKKTRGHIIECRKSDDSCCPIVKFTLENGQTIIKELNQCSSYRVGDSILLLYDEEVTSQVRIYSFGWILIFPLVFVISGLIFYGFPLYTWKSD